MKLRLLALLTAAAMTLPLLVACDEIKIVTGSTAASTDTDAEEGTTTATGTDAALDTEGQTGDSATGDGQQTATGTADDNTAGGDTASDDTANSDAADNTTGGDTANSDAADNTAGGDTASSNDADNSAAEHTGTVDNTAGDDAVDSGKPSDDQLDKEESTTGSNQAPDDSQIRDDGQQSTEGEDMKDIWWNTTEDDPEQATQDEALENDGGSNTDELVQGQLMYTLRDDGQAYGVFFEGDATCIVIPSTYEEKPVTRIEDRAFARCRSLRSLTIPESVTGIGRAALRVCENLEEINYEGTLAQWMAIDKETGWDVSMGRYTVYCLDDKIECGDEMETSEEADTKDGADEDTKYEHVTGDFVLPDKDFAPDLWEGSTAPVFEVDGSADNGYIEGTFPDWAVEGTAPDFEFEEHVTLDGYMEDPSDRYEESLVPDLAPALGDTEKVTLPAEKENDMGFGRLEEATTAD